MTNSEEQPSRVGEREEVSNLELASTQFFAVLWKPEFIMEYQEALLICTVSPASQRTVVLAQSVYHRIYPALPILMKDGTSCDCVVGDRLYMYTYMRFSFRLSVIVVMVLKGRVSLELHL